MTTRPLHPTRRLARRCTAALALATACARGVDTSPTPITEAEEMTRAVLADESSLALALGDTRTVGVAPLGASEPALVPLGYALADFLLADLALSPQLRGVDRTRLHVLLREVALGASGYVDSTTAPRAGRLLRAHQLVLGGLASSSGLQGAVRVDSRVADVSSGRVEVAVSADTRLDEILDAEKELAFRLFDRFGVTLTPAERAAVELRPTRHLGALLAYGRAVRYEVEGRYASAAAEYARAARLDPRFALARTRAYDLRSHADVWPLPVVPFTGQPVGYTIGLGLLGTSVVDRINRTYPIVTSNADSRTAVDASFPITSATLLITVILP